MCFGVIEGTTAAIIGSVVSAVVSTATSVASADAAAKNQERANARAAQAQADQASVKNAAANLKARQEASLLTKEQFKVSREGIQTIGANKAQLAGLEGNFLADVSRTLDMDIDQQQSAIAVQEMFNQDNTALGGVMTTQSQNNAVDGLARGGSSGLVIGNSVLGGLSTGINVGSSIYNSGAFKDAPLVKVGDGG